MKLEHFQRTWLLIEKDPNGQLQQMEGCSLAALEGPGASKLADTATETDYARH